MDKDNIDFEELHNQEVWTKLHFNGYFFSLKDHVLAVEIRIKKPNEEMPTTTQIFCPIDADDDGHVDLTALLHSLLLAIQDNPTCEIKAYTTGFMRQFHFNKDLLSTPIPKSLIDLFGKK